MASILVQNYPNPFNPSTTREFSLPSQSAVRLDIYNALGQLIERLVDDRFDSGTHRIQWMPGDQPAGVYFYRLQAGSFVETKKLILIK